MRDNITVTEMDSSGTSSFMLAGTDVVSPVLTVTKGGTTTSYTPGLSERNIATQVSRFYHADLKNDVQQTNTSQSFDGTKRYDAFGNGVSETGSWSGPFGYGGAFGYQTDSDSGLLLLGHRYYDPSIGRFLSNDPIGDGANWYVYCENNPAKYTDPLGLWKAVIIIGEHSWWEKLVIGIALAKFKRWLRGKGATKIIVLRNPTPEQIVDVLSDDTVEGCVFIGHGPPDDVSGAWLTCRDGYPFGVVQIGQIKQRRRTKMRLFLAYSCNSSRLGNALLDIAVEVYTYEGGASWVDLLYIPKPKTSSGVGFAPKSWEIGGGSFALGGTLKLGY
ncbi:MAG TPA: RHS repeat-associated core domain-containing protein [Fimbriimonadales bacterium]|nr:RHS repeat-associated core domain-containing protein [Fimbriimonadales bacterium]